MYDICMSYTINISLPKQLAELAGKQVKNGYYSSVSEVVRDALRKLFEPEVPAFPMSKKAENKAMKAWSEYKAGKTKELNSLEELNML